MKFYIKDAFGKEQEISVEEAIVRTGYNYETGNDTIDISSSVNHTIKMSIELAKGVSITITKN